MKNIFLLIVLIPFCAVSQSTQWTKTWGEEKSFIENRGQFETMYSLPDKTPVLFAYEGSQENYFFSKNKLTYRFVTLAKRDKDENEFKEMREKKYSPEEWRRCEVEEFRKKVMQEYVSAEWLDANPNVEIVAENRVSYYHSYTYKINGKLTNVNYIPSFEKIRYKNLYPNIDVVYEFHPKGGIKYSVIVYPGGDLSRVKLKYSKPISLKKNGDIYVKSKFGTIIEHAPVSFYNENHQPINSFYSVKDNIISFNVPQSETSKTVIIDPWTQTPFATASNGTWECETDAVGNAYIIGDGMLSYEKLKKYNTTGALQWTYTTTWDTTGYWLGTLGTDLNGNSYITAGSIAEIEKVNTSGTMQFHQNGGYMDEYWAITFNCDQTKLIVGGTRLNALMTITGNGVIFDISTTNGTVLGIVNVGAFKPSPSVDMVNYAEEVRSISAAYNAKCYYLTLDTIGAISDNFSQCLTTTQSFILNSGYQFAYKSENFRPENGNGANMAIKANSNFVYTQNGTTIHKRSLYNGSILDSATIPNGNTLYTVEGYAPDNNGIDIDNCGNVYVGSINMAIKYDANLNPVSSVTNAFRVSDIAVGTGGSVIICGTTDSSGANNRIGYVQSVNFSSCSKISSACCDAHICPIETICINDSTITLSSGTAGGTWSGNGITNASTGTFNPTVAGIGYHTITYSLVCGTDSIIIYVSDCLPINVCYDGTHLISSGGSGIIHWETQTQQTIVPTTPEQCTQCGGTWLSGTCSISSCTVMGWLSYTSGNTAAIPSSWPLLVTDGMDTIIFNSIFDIPSCAACIPPPEINITGTTAICKGNSDTLYANGGIYYLWDNGLTTSEINVSPVTSTTYFVTGTDASGCTNVAQFTITVNDVDNYLINAVGQTAYVTDLPGASYQWIDCQNGNAPIANETGTSYTPILDGYYGVIINQNGCTSTSICVYVDVTHVNQNNQNGSVTVFPNPTTGILNISFVQNMSNTHITLTNVIGKIVVENNNCSIQKGTTTTIDLSVLPSGFYFLNIENRNIHLKFKVVYYKAP